MARPQRCWLLGPTLGFQETLLWALVKELQKQLLHEFMFSGFLCLRSFMSCCSNVPCCFLGFVSWLCYYFALSLTAFHRFCLVAFRLSLFLVLAVFFVLASSCLSLFLFLALRFLLVSYRLLLSLASCVSLILLVMLLLLLFFFFSFF